MSYDQNEPIRVLQVVTNMSYGGLENLLMNYYRNIDRTKVQFDFLTHVDIHQDFEEEIAALGGQIYRLPRLNPFSPDYLRKLDGFFRDHPQYRVVHCHLNCMSSVVLKAAMEHRVAGRIAHSHGSSHNFDLKYPIRILSRNRIPRYATALFSCGKAAGDWMFRGKSYTILANAIDAAEFRLDRNRSALVRRELGLEGKFVVGHVGQLRPEKNHLFLIDVFAELLKLQPESRLVLVGKGPQMEPCVAKAEQLGIREKILFLGARADIARLMQAMDVFVLPSTTEGLPVTMVEAQAAGLPCMISDGVPIECKLTEDVVQIPLAEPPAYWAEALAGFWGKEKKDSYDTIVKAGFDVRTNVQWLQTYYLNAHNGE